MRVTYFDEVKANPQNGQPWYVVGGLSVPADAIPQLEERANTLAEDVFGTRDLTAATEFHAAHIYFGKGSYRGMAVSDRLEILCNLGKAISETDGVKRVYAAIDTSKLANPAKAPEMAFAYFASVCRSHSAGGQPPF